MAHTKGTLADLENSGVIRVQVPAFTPDPRYAGMEETLSIVRNLPVSKTDGEYWYTPEVQEDKNRDVWIAAARTLSTPDHRWGDSTRKISMSWAFDAFVGAGLLEEAVKMRPVVSLLEQASAKTEAKVSVKNALGIYLDGSDLIGLFGNKMTEYGRQNVDSIIPFLDAHLYARQKQEGQDLVREWMTVSGHPPSLFSGFPAHIHTDAYQCYRINWQGPGEQAARVLIREAENTHREECGIPRIGEGWVSETALFYAIKRSFPDHVVEQHARPTWLGRQHLDIFFPELGVALEYQGVQHDRPIEFFGGQTAFEATRKRDQRKYRLTKRNGIHLIYVREGYRIEDVFEEIRQHVKR